MEICSLRFAHYRNLRDVTLEPTCGFNILWGENAQGKTNFLEGIYLLGTLKSFRSAKNPELVQHQQRSARIEAILSSFKVKHRLDLSISEEGKRPRIDGKDVVRSSEYFGMLRPVLFSPEEVNLVKGPPSGRRSLIDRALFQTDVGYLDRMRDFDRTLRHRNRLLKEERTTSELIPWTENLIRLGAQIRQNRFLFVERLQELLQQTYREISGDRENACIEYCEGSPDLEVLQSVLAREAEKVGAREQQQGVTLFGPHRDDPLFSVDGKPLRVFGSQGQQRSFILAFKTAQILDLERKTGEAPILLLDDMTSELDRSRQEYFFRFLLNRSGQVFITTTEIQPLMAQGIRDAHFFRVDKGSVHQERMA